MPTIPLSDRLVVVSAITIAAVLAGAVIAFIGHRNLLKTVVISGAVALTITTVMEAYDIKDRISDIETYLLYLMGPVAGAVFGGRRVHRTTDDTDRNAVSPRETLIETSIVSGKDVEGGWRINGDGRQTVPNNTARSGAEVQPDVGVPPGWTIGEARSVERRKLPTSSPKGPGSEVLSFRLTQINARGETVSETAIELRGNSVGGSLKNGDRIAAPFDSKRIDRIYNISTATYVVARPPNGLGCFLITIVIFAGIVFGSLYLLSHHH